MNSVEAPLLTVGIPTYNRPHLFERVLLEIIPQLTPDTELLIRDDSPNAETEMVVKKHLAGSAVHYRYVHGEKIGLDKANIFLLREARGRYIWWFSDDDEILPGAISHVLDIVKHSPDTNFIWANFQIEGQRKPVVNGPDGFVSPGEMLDRVGTGIGLVSTLIMRREAALKYADMALANSIGFGFAGLIPPLGAMSEPGRSYILAKSYILNHPTSREEVIEMTTRTGKVKNDGFYVYGVVFYKILRLFEGKIDRRAIRRLLKKSFGYLWRGMLVGYIGGWDTPKGKRWQMFKLYWNYPEFWIAIWPMLLPRTVDTWLLKVYKWFFPKTFVAS